MNRGYGLIFLVIFTGIFAAVAMVAMLTLRQFFIERSFAAVDRLRGAAALRTCTSLGIARGQAWGEFPVPRTYVIDDFTCRIVFYKKEATVITIEAEISARNFYLRERYSVGS